MNCLPGVSISDFGKCIYYPIWEFPNISDNNTSLLFTIKPSGEISYNLLVSLECYIPRVRVIFDHSWIVRTCCSWLPFILWLWGSLFNWFHTGTSLSGQPKSMFPIMVTNIWLQINFLIFFRYETIFASRIRVDLVKKVSGKKNCTSLWTFYKTD